MTTEHAPDPDDLREELAAAAADIARLRRLRRLTVECGFPELTADLDYQIAVAEDIVDLIGRAGQNGTGADDE